MIKERVVHLVKKSVDLPVWIAPIEFLSIALFPLIIAPKIYHETHNIPLTFSSLFLSLPVLFHVLGILANNSRIERQVVNREPKATFNLSVDDETFEERRQKVRDLFNKIRRS